MVRYTSMEQTFEALAKIDRPLNEQLLAFLSAAVDRGNVFKDPRDVGKLTAVADGLSNGKVDKDIVTLVESFCNLFLKGGAARDMAEAGNLITLFQQFQFYTEISEIRARNAASTTASTTASE